MTTINSHKSRSIPIRMTAIDFDIIDQAASVVGESRAEFLRSAAKARAKKILKKHKEFLVSRTEEESNARLVVGY